MVLHLKTSVRSLILNRFYTVVAMDVISKEVIASYDSILYDISYSYGYAHIMLLFCAVLYNMMNAGVNKRIETLVERGSVPFVERGSVPLVETLVERRAEPSVEERSSADPKYAVWYIRGSLLVLFLVLTRNVQNAI